MRIRIFLYAMIVGTQQQTAQALLLTHARTLRNTVELIEQRTNPVAPNAHKLQCALWNRRQMQGAYECEHLSPADKQQCAFMAVHMPWRVPLSWWLSKPLDRFVLLAHAELQELDMYLQQLDQLLQPRIRWLSWDAVCSAPRELRERSVMQPLLASALMRVLNNTYVTDNCALNSVSLVPAIQMPAVEQTLVALYAGRYASAGCATPLHTDAVRTWLRCVVLRARIYALLRIVLANAPR